MGGKERVKDGDRTMAKLSGALAWRDEVAMDPEEIDEFSRDDGSRA
jgi:hypothetical protein